MDPVAPDGSKSLGNTKPSSVASKKRINAAKRWCFTWNNPNKDIGSTFQMLSKYGNIIIGDEIAPSTGTHHFQGYIEFNNKCRPSELIKINEIHWEKTKGTKEDNITYCSKDNNYLSNFDENEELEDEFINYKPKEWQEFVLNEINNKPDKRIIYWFYDNNGNTGKTTLCKHICINNKNALYINGKANDIKYAISESKNKPKILLFDFTRTNEEHISYDAIESVKNGIFFSGKYESKQIIYNTPHVFCFANFYPDTVKLSEDRWRIRLIE